MLNSILLGSSKLMQRVREQITMLAALPWHVRVNGPTAPERISRPG